MRLLNDLKKNKCSIIAKMSRYDGLESQEEVVFKLDEPIKVFELNHAVWKCSMEETAIEGHMDAIDVSMSLSLLQGTALQNVLSIELEFADWSSDNYVLMPAAVYNGNRFDYLPLAYPPFIGNKSDMKIDFPITITDVPRLNKYEGASRIDLLTGDLSTSAIGFHAPESQLGFILLTEQQTAAGETGLHVHENENRSLATLRMTFPGMRENKIYRMCNTQGADSPDKGVDYEVGDGFTVRFRMYFFRSSSIQALFDYFVEVRKDLSGETVLKNSIPFSKAWAIQETAYNERWNEIGEYYPSFNQGFLDYQIGWVGGMQATHALLTEGDEISRERSIRCIHRLVTQMQSPSGFFYSSGKDGEFYSDGIWEPWPHNMHGIRKNGDALYFLIKQCMLLEKNDSSWKIPSEWKTGITQLADAFVNLWETYGQFGQIIDIETGEILIGGSTAAAIVPAGLALAGQYLNDPAYIEIAEKAGNMFYKRDVQAGVTTGCPTENLQCPDSESAYALLESFIVLYEVTERQIWLARACEIAHQCATWNVSYDYKWPVEAEFGRLGMQTTGSVVANVQNKHSSPGICTLSGDSLFKLFRATGNQMYLQLIKETAHNLPQYLSREDRPIMSWDEVSVSLPPGMMCERVNMSDWEGKENIGGVFCGITWAEIANMLTFAEIPGFMFSQIRGCYVSLITSMLKSSKLHR